MANVFGNPITDSTLKGMAEYANKETTAVDRAHVAINMKDTNTRTYVENLKEECGTEGSTLSGIYNATGNPMTFVCSQEWHGHPTVLYPSELQNGQGAEFMNVKDSFGSVVVVVYSDGIGNCDHMMAWSNPRPSTGYKNSVWAETREAGHYDHPYVWGPIYRKLTEPRNNHCDIWNGWVSRITITDDISAKVEATFSFKLCVPARSYT